MQLNITFVVQIINFWVTYSVLRKLFFRPLVAHISRKEQARYALLEGLKEKERLLVHLQEQKKNDLEDFRDRIKKQYQPAAVQLLDLPAEIDYQPNEQALTELADAATQILVKEAEHAW